MIWSLLFPFGIIYHTCSALQFKRDDYIIHDMLTSSPIFSKTADSSLHCAILCEADIDCTKYTHDHVNSDCFGYGKLPPNFKIVINKDALKTMSSFRTKSEGQPGCEESGYFINKKYGLCWRYVNVQTKFSDAVQMCKDLGGSMITHVTKSKAKYINGIHSSHGRSGGWYLGMTDRKKEGTWLWLDGTKSDFKFPKGADNDYDGAFRGKGADCAVVHKSDHTVFDVYCGAKYSFVCERRDLL